MSDLNSDVSDKNLRILSLTNISNLLLVLVKKGLHNHGNFVQEIIKMNVKISEAVVNCLADNEK